MHASVKGLRWDAAELQMESGGILEGFEWTFHTCCSVHRVL